MKFPLPFWLLLIVGIAVRCVALTHPLVDAHLLRQCQTATATQSLLDGPGLQLSTPMWWAADTGERFVVELPLYNYLAAGLAVLTGQLTASGKLVSIALWALSFVLLQSLWRRALDPISALWANVLFVFSPLSVFYSQAFMPEMLVQVLSFAFLVLLVRHHESPTLGRWITAAAAGLLGLLVKSPETAHLYLVFVLLAISRSGWKSLFWPRNIIAGILTVLCVAGWSAYLNSMNTSPLTFGGTSRNLAGFIGPLSLRFKAHTWIVIALYLGAFVFPGPPALAVVAGAWDAARHRRTTRLLAIWLAATVLYYLTWLGNGPASQSYYNLPGLAPLCALFGLGMRWLFELPQIQPRRTLVAAASLSLTIGCAVPVWIYLFTPDQTLLAATEWARDNIPRGSIVLFRATHRADMLDYEPNAAFPFYARRSTYVWASTLPEPYRSDALNRSSFAIVTLPQPATAATRLVSRFHSQSIPLRESTDWLRDAGFHPVAETPQFVAFARH